MASPVFNLAALDQLNATNPDSLPTMMVREPLADPSIQSEFLGLIEEINASHMFLKQVMRGARVPSAAELPELQKTIERFAIGTSLASKIITNMVKNIDTLVRMQ